MGLDKLQDVELPASADMHVHLRDGAMMEVVVPTIRAGGVDTVLVMPNLVPPITTVEQALDYKQRLQAIDPSITYLMSLYLHPSITPTTIAAAAAAGITSVKSYPAGVTTNSDSGVIDYAAFYPVFAAMQDHDMVLNLHGELPASAGPDITVLNAEEAFLPTLMALHERFPRLRIVLEHCTTEAAVEAVRKCGSTVAATITAHHLYLTIDDVVGNCYNFCKPVSKLPADRRALLSAVVSGDPKFFFGSDSAPHTIASKERRGSPAAGCFTQGWASQLVLDALEVAVKKGMVGEERVTREVLEGFLGGFGRRFYRLGSTEGRIVLRKGGERVGALVGTEEGGVQIAPFRAGEETWSLRWKK